MRGNLSSRVDRLEGSQGGAPVHAGGYSVILEEGLEDEAREAEIRAQLAAKGIEKMPPGYWLIIHEIVSPKREGLLA